MSSSCNAVCTGWFRGAFLCYQCFSSLVVHAKWWYGCLSFCHVSQQAFFIYNMISFMRQDTQYKNNVKKTITSLCLTGNWRASHLPSALLTRFEHQKVKYKAKCSILQRIRCKTMILQGTSFVLPYKRYTDCHIVTILSVSLQLLNTQLFQVYFIVNLAYQQNVKDISRSGSLHVITYRVAQKSKPLPIDQKIVLKPVSEIIFIRQIKVWIQHHNIIRCH